MKRQTDWAGGSSLRPPKVSIFRDTDGQIRQKVGNAKTVKKKKAGRKINFAEDGEKTFVGERCIA